MTRGAARGLAMALAATVAAASCAPADVACAPIEGGEPGSVVQLRGVRWGDDRISFVFGLRAGGAQYGIPPHVVERVGDVIRVRLVGARSLYPDGSPSYLGERDPSPPPGRLAAVSVRDEGDEGVTFDVHVTGRSCPRVLARRYGLGSTHPAALVSVALHDGPAVVLDPDHGVPGFPTQVVGLGFTPSDPVAFHSGGRTLWTSRSDRRGDLDTTFFVPSFSPGSHAVVVRDGARAATAWFRVDR